MSKPIVVQFQDLRHRPQKSPVGLSTLFLSFGLGPAGHAEEGLVSVLPFGLAALLLAQDECNGALRAAYGAIDSCSGASQSLDCIQKIDDDLAGVPSRSTTTAAWLCELVRTTATEVLALMQGWIVAQALMLTTRGWPVRRMSRSSMLRPSRG